MPTAIGKIDKNLDVPRRLNEPNICWHDVPGAPFTLYGLLPPKEGRPFLRLPEAVAAAVSPGVAALAPHTAGGRVSFATDSPYVALRAATPAPSVMPHMTLVNQAGFDLYVRCEDGRDVYAGSLIPPCGMDRGFESIVRLGKEKLRQITINFPLYNGVDALQLGVAPGAQVETFHACEDGAPVVFYGSSITQGGCSSRPGLCYPAILARALHVDHLNLGFSGSAKGEDAMADYIASLPMRALVMAYDQNAPDLAHLERTHLPMLRAVRRAQPELPILVTNYPTVLLPQVEAFGPRRDLIAANCRTLQDEGDRHIRFVDGFSLMAGAEEDGCTVDGVHPNDLGFYRMAKGLLPHLREMLNL